jgi:aminoglycoside phosphotransferase (APT) family kinase protein
MSNEFLHQRHASYRTPEAMLHALVNNAVGQNIRHLAPITSGYANEVYRVDTENDDALIIRIGRSGTTSLITEAWAMQQARQAGVPVPLIYATPQITTDENHVLEVMVMQHVAGRSLASVQAQLTTSELAQIYQQLGVLLRKLHHIPVAGFGAFQSHDQASFADWHTYVQSTHKQRVADVPYLLQAGLGASEAATLLDIASELQFVSAPEPVLCHGDLSNEHIFVNDELTITGIIDFGQCQGGLPALDVAVLLMFHPEIDLAWITQGYNGTPHTDGLSRRHIFAHQANIQMSYLAYDVQAGNMDSREIALQSMRQLIREWQQAHMI